MGVPEGADLATTPISPPENHFIRINGVAELQTDGTLTGRITITAEGQSDASVRGMFKYSNRTQWFQNVEKELLRVWPQANVSLVKYSDPVDYQNYNIWVAIDYKIPEFAFISGNTMMFTPLTTAQIFKSYQGHLAFDTGLKERKYPFRDRCSRRVELEESIQLPLFKKVIRIPESITKNGEAASFIGGYELNGNVLLFSGKAKLAKRIYNAGDWPDFKAVVEAQNSFSEKPVIIEL